MNSSLGLPGAHQVHTLIRMSKAFPVCIQGFLDLSFQSVRTGLLTALAQSKVVALKRGNGLPTCQEVLQARASRCE